MDTKSFPYKRINHFSEWISQYNTDNIDIPDNVYIQITDKITEDNKDIKQLTFRDIKIILKKIRLTKYYAYVPHILSRIQNIPMPTIDRETERILKKMFIKICEVYDECRPANRISFISYAYVLHKLCQLINRNDLLIYFTISLKSRDKLRQHDIIWMGICSKLEWRFISSI